MNSTPDEGENVLRDAADPLEAERDVAEDHDVAELNDDDDDDNDANDDNDAPALNSSRPEGRDGDTAAEAETETDPDALQEALTPAGSQPEPQQADTNGVAAALLPDHKHSLLETDDSFSTPDDSPSVQGSILSSPRSETASLLSPARRGSPSNVHRPFDARFQSRLSGSNFSPLRSSSPAFLGSHSRHGSLASLGPPPPSETDETVDPWEVIRWSKYKKITGQAFSEIGKRNFGSPTCLATADQLVIGTSKGVVLIFDHQQNHKAIIGSGTKAAECGAVTALALSADHTTIAVGHATGHIFTWEVAKPARPFLHIQPIDNSLAQARKADGHVAGSAVLHIGFLGYRHTALVSADDKGMAFSHLATRGMGAVGRVVRTSRILGRYPEVVARSAKPLKKSSVLAFSPLPLGNVEQSTDGSGLVAMMTPYLLVIVSTTPIAQTQHKAARPKEVAAHSAMTAALAWFPAIKLKTDDSEVSRTKLAYAWSNILTILEVHEIEPEDEEVDRGKPPELQFPARSRYQAQEAIVAVQWLNKSVLAVLTITQQLLIIEDLTMHVTESFDLLKKHVYHADLYSQQLRAIIEQLDDEDASLHGVVADAFHMSFRAYKGRLFLLGFNDVWWGALTNWADRLLALMNVGDFIGAIRLATKYYQGEGEKATIGLPEDDAHRADLVREKLTEMMSASLRYAFGKNQKADNEPIEKPLMVELADACIRACLVMEDRDFLFEEVFAWYDDHDNGSMFIDVLEPYILDRRISSLPPPALKTLINHFATTHAPSTLEEIICMLDTTTMDIDQVTGLCKKYNLYDAYIYVWTMTLRDFATPTTMLLDFAPDQENGIHSPKETAERYNAAQKLFPYLSFILTGRVYPTGADFDTEDEADAAKGQIYDLLFSGSTAANGVSKSARTRTSRSFSVLNRILQFDAASFVASLNEAFEDSFLNTSEDDTVRSSGQPQSLASRLYTRQYIVRIMLEVMSGFDADDSIYLDMFIARNLAKYPQYMVLSGTVLQEVFDRLCRYPEEDMRDDAQLSVEYLLSIYQPPNYQVFVPLLQEAKFYRVLKSVFKQEHQYSDMIETYFLDLEDQDGVFAAITECLRPQSSLLQQQRDEVRSTLQEHALDLVNIDIRRTAETVDDVAPNLHQTFLDALSSNLFGQYSYLNPLLEPEDSTKSRKSYNRDMLETYIRLLCQFEPLHVKDYIESMREGEIRLSSVIPDLEASGAIDALVTLQAKNGQVREAMDRLTSHLSSLSATLQGLITSPLSDDDAASVVHPTQPLLDSIEQYTRIGVWLAKTQMKAAPKQTIAKSPRPNANSSRVLSPEELLWLELIVCVVGIARELSINLATKSPTSSPAETATSDGRLEVVSSLRTTVQEVFTSLLTSTSHPGTRDMAFLRILRAFLSHASEVTPSLSELRSVIASIFSAYAYEEKLLSLSNAMLDSDVFLSVDEVSKLRGQGWRPRGQVCELCRRRLWGPGLGEEVWGEWERKEGVRQERRLRSRGEEAATSPELEGRGKGKAVAGGPVQGESRTAGKPGETGAAGLAIVVFRCRHVYHRLCLGHGVPLPDGSSRLLCPACV